MNVKCYLEHAHFTVTDIDAAIRFLMTAFPHFKVRKDGVSGSGESIHRWVHVGTDATYITLAGPHGKVLSSVERRPYFDGGVNHLGWVVDDLDAVSARLSAAGYRQGIAVDPHPHRKRIYFHDDAGFEWEFVQYLSDVPEERNDYTL